MEELVRRCAFVICGIKTTAAGCEGIRPTKSLVRIHQSWSPHEVRFITEGSQDPLESILCSFFLFIHLDF